MPSIILSDNGVSSGSAGLKTTAASDGSLALQTTTAGGTATTAVTIDTSQNVGLGVTPSAWDSVFKSFDIVSTGSVFAASSNINFGYNVYYNSGYKYKTTAGATFFRANASGFEWNIAASGTAGNTISFTQAMTLDASGNLGIGTTSPASRLSVDAARSDTAGTGWFTYTNVSTTSGKRAMRVDTSNGHWFDYYNGSSWSAQVGIDSSGNLLVGQTTTGLQAARSFSFQGAGDGSCYVSHSTANASGDSYIQFGYNGTKIGSITQNGTTATAYNTSSDYRLKENIVPMTGALSLVQQLKPCTYNWKSDGSEGQGFIAHELQEVVPECVTGEKDAVDENGNPKYQGIDTSFLVATLTAAIQELKAEFDAYKATHP